MLSDFEKQLISDLAKKYTFKNFDFNKSPEDLLTTYQETFEKLENVIYKQNAEIASESAKFLNDFL
jgi:hypothetical protein